MMHPSYFLLLRSSDVDSTIELPLPADVSEWLFHIKFWDRFNNKYHTQFMQYEEEELSPSLVPELIAEINGLINQLVEREKSETASRWGWDAKSRKPLGCVVHNSFLLDNLSRLLAFLERAKELQSEIYCQL